MKRPSSSPFLADNRCDEAQGYLFSRPVPETHVVPILFGVRMPDVGKASPSSNAFPQLVSQIADANMPRDRAVAALLRELTALSGLDTTFFTTVDRDLTHQVIRHADNVGPVTVEDGLTVEWCDTMCRRMIEDNVVHSADVGRRYSDSEVARTFGIETYVSIPIRDGDGALLGTLCGASTERKQVDSAVIELMQLFAQVLSERMGPSAPSAITGPSARGITDTPLRRRTSTAP